MNYPRLFLRSVTLFSVALAASAGPREISVEELRQDLANFSLDTRPAAVSHRSPQPPIVVESAHSGFVYCDTLLEHPVTFIDGEIWISPSSPNVRDPKLVKVLNIGSGLNPKYGKFGFNLDRKLIEALDNFIESKLQMKSRGNRARILDGMIRVAAQSLLIADGSVLKPDQIPKIEMISAIAEGSAVYRDSGTRLTMTIDPEIVNVIKQNLGGNKVTAFVRGAVYYFLRNKDAYADLPLRR